MYVDTVSIDIAGIGEMDFLQYVPLHGHRRVVAEFTLIREFEPVVSFKAMNTRSAAGQSNAR